jgi:hypothetical protein
VLIPCWAEGRYWEKYLTKSWIFSTGQFLKYFLKLSTEYLISLYLKVQGGV